MAFGSALLTVRRQIGLLGAVGLVGVLATSSVPLFSMRTLTTLQHQAHDLSNQAIVAQKLDADLLDVRQAEKTFQLEPSDAAAAQHERAAHAALDATKQLASMLSARESGVARLKLDEVAGGLAAYRETFVAFVQVSRDLGFDQNSGLQGRLRNSVRAVEAKLAEHDELRLANLMLQMRRHEKDFMLRVDTAYRGDLKKRGVEFEAALKVSGLSEAMRTDIAGKMTAYLRDVDAYMEGRLRVKETAAAMTKALAAIEPILKTVETSIAAAQDTGQAEITAARESAERLVLVLIGGVLLAVGAISFVIGRAVARPITAMTDTMEQLARGDTNTVVPGLKRRDEIGAMARAVDVFKVNALERMRLEAASAGERERLEAEKRKAMQSLADVFEAKVGRLVDALAASATELEQTARSMSGAAEQATAESGTVSAAAETTSANVQTAAAAVEELSAAAREIGERITEASHIAAQAAADAGKADETMAGLSSGAQRIGDVVGLIRSVAEQTSLLALNATIEAARAGEAGRGFAVVATEVKALAMQASKATDEIAGQIDEIQAATRRAVGAVQGIAKTVQTISSISATIASAAEQQQSATAEITQTVSAAARGTEGVSSSIGRVRMAAVHTGAAAEQVLTAAGELSRGSNELSGEVAGFLAEVRAA